MGKVFIPSKSLRIPHVYDHLMQRSLYRKLRIPSHQIYSLSHLLLQELRCRQQYPRGKVRAPSNHQKHHRQHSRYQLLLHRDAVFLCIFLSLLRNTVCYFSRHSAYHKGILWQEVLWGNPNYPRHVPLHHFERSTCPFLQKRVHAEWDYTQLLQYFHCFSATQWIRTQMETHAHNSWCRPPAGGSMTQQYS